MSVTMVSFAELTALVPYITLSFCTFFQLLEGISAVCTLKFILLCVPMPGWRHRAHYTSKIKK